MSFPSCAPSAVRLDASGVLDLLDAIEAHPTIEPHGLIVQRHGRRAFEGYWSPHTGGRHRLVYSVSKSFTGTALALALGEGRLSLDDLVSDHLPDLFDDRSSEGARQMRIRHIASMATGHDHETIMEAFGIDRDDPVRGFLRVPTDREPGTVFAYNQPPVLALSTILQRLTGERLSDYLRPRLLEPLGIDTFQWARGPGAVDLGFSGVHTDLDAVARLGQLYLDDGVWDGRRLLPEGWVADASRPQIANPGEPTVDWQQGYGFQLWMSRHGYRGDGAFGQYMVVLPEHDAVVAMFSTTTDMQDVLDLFWTHLLPAMAASDGPTVVDSSDADVALAARAASLALPVAATRHGGGAPDVVAAAGSYLPGERFASSHRSIERIELDGDRLTVHEGDDALDLPVRGEWTIAPNGAIATSATTARDGRLVIDVSFLEVPHRLVITLDPATKQFGTRWPLMPLFGFGSPSRLGALRAPTS